MKSLMKIGAGLLAAASLAGCGGSGTTVPGLTAVGSYSATQFVTTGGSPSGITNQLANGGSFHITLASNGTTTGHLSIAAGGNTPALEADMAGTWAQDGQTITFSQAADTFVRNTPFTLTANGGGTWDLVADKTFSNTEFAIRLSRV
ncbi:MAG TPA: hypothetical protein VGG76_01285 [Gemmatimonadaceae bacterium]|jgi:hypothetical protein